MANEDPVLGQERNDFSFAQTPHYGLNEHTEEDVVIEENHHTLGLEDNHEPDMDLEQTKENTLELENSHDFMLSQPDDQDPDQNQEIPLSDPNENQNTYEEATEENKSYSHELNLTEDKSYSHELNLTEDKSYSHELNLTEDKSYSHELNLTDNTNPEVNDMVNSDRQMVVLSEQNDDLGMLENHELAIVDNHVIDDDLALVVDHNHVEHHNHNHHEMGLIPSSDMSIEQSHLIYASPIVQTRTMIAAPTYELIVGQEFPDVKSCRRALRDMAIALHFEIQTVKSDKTRFTAKCASEGCPWRVHAAKLPGVPTFSLRTIHGEHSCRGISHLGHQQASVEWVANSLEERLRVNPNYKPKEILEEIHRTHGITLSYKQAWRGKERIMASLRGSFEEDYKLLPQYCEQIRRTNPGSIASVYVNPNDNCFQRLFVSFQASIYGFINACRPLIGLDRTVLKSKYLGTLLFATAFDGDGELFPLAFGVVDEENDENWMWFLSEMRVLLELNTENMPRLTILSDRHKSIADGVEVNFPTAFHGFCMHHLSESFRKEFNNSMLVNLLIDAGNALTISEYDLKIHEIGEVSPDAAYWIQRVPPRLWANAYFEGTRFGNQTVNIVESLNTWILEASSLPIVQMMECIRRQLMTWFNERRENSMQWTSILVPRAEARVGDAIERARTFQVLRANEAEFEVISHEGTNIVDIRNRFCSCRGWQIYGLPCSHAVAALLSCRQNVHRFTESCFTVATYRKAYSQTIHPVPDRTLWKEMSDEMNGGCEVVVNPPKSLRPPGQPRKKRARQDDRNRAKRVVHCSRCNQTGHFRTTCVAPI